VRDRTDFFWDRQRIVGESDGYEKYLAATAEETASRVILEKKREDRLRRNLNGFARWDWASVLQVAPLRRTLMHVGVPIVRPPALALLETLGPSAQPSSYR
jgi:hypothetical protein